MQLHSIEHQVQNLHVAGHSIREIASELNIDKSKVHRILRRLQEPGDTGSNTPSNTPDNFNDTNIDTDKDNTETSLQKSKKLNIMSQNIVKTEGFNDVKPKIGHLKHTFSLINICIKESKEFIEEIAFVYTEGEYWWYMDFERYGKTVDRLIQTATILGLQVGENPKDLLILDILISIKAKHTETLQKQRNDIEPEHFIDLDHSPEMAQFWRTGLTADFFQPINDYPWN